jgi:hypothetical protein
VALGVVAQQCGGVRRIKQKEGYNVQGIQVIKRKFPEKVLPGIKGVPILLFCGSIYLYRCDEAELVLGLPREDSIR